MSRHDEDARQAVRDDIARDERDAARWSDTPPARSRTRVTTAGSLQAQDLGRRVRVEGLHQPGTDWDAEKVTVEGILTGYHARDTGLSRARVDLTLRPEPNADLRLPADHPVHVL